MESINSVSAAGAGGNYGAGGGGGYGYAGGVGKQGLICIIYAPIAPQAAMSIGI
jgi:hypothetical protein